MQVACLFVTAQACVYFGQLFGRVPKLWSPSNHFRLAEKVQGNQVVGPILCWWGQIEKVDRQALGTYYLG